MRTKQPTKQNERVPTAMELALRKAQQQKAKEQKGK